jgi:hypothetical protein
MTDTLLAAGLGSIAILCALAANALTRRAAQARVRASLPASPCSACGNILGAEAISTADEVRYNWTLSRGNTVSSLSLPHWTFQITCPHCRSIVEYCENGRAFPHPQTGVIGFTRTIKSKARPSPKSPAPTGVRASAPANANHALPNS